MTRPLDQLQQAKSLIEAGLSQAETARRLGIPRSTVVTWVREGFPVARRSLRCDPCPHIASAVHDPAYAYLLGLYLGDGCISPMPRGVYKLRIALDVKYPGIIDECRCAMFFVSRNRVGEVMSIGCVNVWCYWKHWPCLFPQHGPGLKHRRPIVLEPWQRAVALERYPHLLLRGLIHSDGCRTVNTVKVRGKEYAYSRYHFSNRSSDIQGIFTEACQTLGIHCRFNNRWNQSIARRLDVKRTDLFVGKKF